MSGGSMAKTNQIYLRGSRPPEPPTPAKKARKVTNYPSPPYTRLALDDRTTYRPGSQDAAKIKSIFRPEIEVKK